MHLHKVSLETVNRQISIIYLRVMALVNVLKMVFGLLFPNYLESHDETSQKGSK